MTFQAPQTQKFGGSGLWGTGVICNSFGEAEGRKGGKRWNCLNFFYTSGFYFGKAVQKKIQQNVAVKSTNQILSIKKFRLTISSEEGKGKAKNGGKVRQTAGLRNEGHFPEHFAEEDRVVTGSGSQAVFDNIGVSSLQSYWTTSPMRQQGCWDSCLPGASPFLQQEGRVVAKETGAGLRLASDQVYSKG